MSNFFKILTITGLIALSYSVKAQYYLLGQDPASVKWRQIKTPYFQIVYPENYTSRAQYYINVLNLVAPVDNKDYQSSLHRRTVILHNKTSSSNAVTAIAPSRMDILDLQPQETYPQIWQDQLALHEYRHVVQERKMRQGLTKGLYYALGEQGVALIIGLYLPFWFLEGDAVYAETVHSSSGRGRIPDFIYPLQSQVLDRRIYKYDKAVYGSFRDFVPDHYTLGYQLITSGIESHGIGLWNNTMNLVARRPYYILPFSISLKKETGFYKVKYYKKTMQSLKQEWWVHDKPSTDSSIKIVTHVKKHYTNYLFPNVLSDGSVIAEKTGIEDINRFVRIFPDRKEQLIFTPGFDFNQTLSVSDSLICWNEKTYDPRWGLRDYSVVKIYNIETHEVKKLTGRTRYFSPVISNSGKYIATVRVSYNAECFLDILDVTTGIVVKEIHTKDNLYFISPHWSSNDGYIAVIVLGKKGKSIVLFDTKSWQMKTILPFSFKEIKWPVMYGNWVVYTGTYEGKDNIYAVDVTTLQVNKVFESRFGANNANFSKDGKNLYFSYYTSEGNRLAKIPFKPANFISVNIPDLHTNYLADRLVNDQTFNLDKTKVPDSVYPTKKYSRIGHLFNLHSWAPVSVDADNFSINPGITLLSQNELSTAISSINYNYNVNERTNNIKFSFDYYGWYPLISLGVEYGGRRDIYQPDSGDVVHLKWNETNLSLSLSVPLNLTRSKWIKGIQPMAGIDQKFRGKFQHNDTLSFKESSITAPYYRFYAYNQLKRSPKDIYPKWGQSIDLIYRHTPFSKYKNYQAGLTAWLYIPGIIKHQGIRIYGGYQKSMAESYSFSNFVAVPRGYSGVYYHEYFTIRSDYAFPIAYPDLDVPGVFYLKRIYSKLFYDYLWGTDSKTAIHNLSSLGAEVYTDWHFISILINFNLGLRVSHRFADNRQFYEFLFGFSY